MFVNEVKMKESDLIRKITEYLRTVKSLFFWKEHGGMYGTAGIPDLIVCYRGRFIAFECKVGKNTPTVLQAQTIRQIIPAGDKEAPTRLGSITKVYLVSRYRKRI